MLVSNFMPSQPIACPHCGLTLTVKTGTVTDFKYDAEEWKRLCEHPDLGSPIFVFLVRCSGLHRTAGDSGTRPFAVYATGCAADVPGPRMGHGRVLRTVQASSNPQVPRARGHPAPRPAEPLEEPCARPASTSSPRRAALPYSFEDIEVTSRSGARRRGAGPGDGN